MRSTIGSWRAPLGPLNVTLVAVPEGGRPRVPDRLLRRGVPGVCRPDRGAARRRCGPAADRNDLRHPEREGRDRRRDRRGTRTPPLDLGDDRRPQRPDPVRSDRRGVLDIGGARRADRRRASTARWARPRCARTSRPSPASPRCRSPATPTPDSRTRSAATTRPPRSPASLLAEFARAGLVNIVGGCCGTTPEHTARSPTRSGSWPRGTVPTFDERAAHVQRPGAVPDPHATPGSS